MPLKMKNRSMQARWFSAQPDIDRLAWIPKRDELSNAKF